MGGPLCALRSAKNEIRDEVVSIAKQQTRPYVTHPVAFFTLEQR
jgi:hypothetical protein